MFSLSHGADRPSQARVGPSPFSFALLPRHGVSDLLCYPHLLGSVASLHMGLKTMGEIDQGTGSGPKQARSPSKLIILAVRYDDGDMSNTR